MIKQIVKRFMPQPMVKKISQVRLIRAKTPQILFIEATNYCNLSCVTCYSTQRKKGYMSFELFKKIVDDAADLRIQTVYLHYGGELFLHPQIKDFIAYACSKHPQINTVAFISNGMLFTRDIAETVIKTGLDCCQFSLDGLGKQNDAIRVGANYEVIEENINYLLKLRGNNPKPTVHLHFTWFNQTKQDIDAFTDHWVNKVNSIHINPYVNPKFQIQDINKYSELYPINEHSFCSSPFTTMGVFWNGEVVPCCHDHNLTLNMGNLKDTSINEVWNGAKFKQLRTDLTAHHATNPVCQECTFWKPYFPETTTYLKGKVQRTCTSDISISYQSS